ncbi:MAG: Nucleoside triphosphate pyrophosphohydrolase [Candidatus Tokpelaia hoelldobleri]|uniref:Nucleoside triphosphate pyrophosphohydrolase n=1 Tax=Candidatus Tokpelaia hoelldobleri TaxID=1902579 RepID=A0A1U9JV03_9HYPH|nr:MAG: Nucleoside triphosphate pyrophosphohydrolase [Candidatus Tokpelaia hoelldoblerii]
MKPGKDIQRLIEIMAALRHPQSGCAWDIKQTFQSIVPYTIEETYEVVDAINRNDRVDLCEELGDLLLQVVYYARMAEEEGSFDFGDVVEGITAKMIRRHPHVFGSTQERQQGMQKGAWERIKAQEKAENRAKKQQAEQREETAQSYLDAVPTALPAAMEAMKLQNHAAKVGFDWPDADNVLDKLAEETAELTAAIEEGTPQDIAAEYGDVMFAVINLGRKLNLAPEEALAMTNLKFRKRFAYIEQNTDKKLEEMTLQDMETLWVKAKKG